jgi:sugar phosphate isomerase/epimerase
MIGKHAMSKGWTVSAFGDEIAPELEPQLEVLADHGLRHVEFRSAWGTNVCDLSKEELDRAARLLREAGIGVSAIASPVGKAPVQGDFEDELARFRAALEAADSLGTPLIRVFSFYVPEGDHPIHRDGVLRRMSVLAREAAVNGVTLVHENESYIYGDTAEHCCDLIDGVASPALRLAFDPANFVQVGVRPHTEAWPRLAGAVAHFHVKDAVAIDRDGFEPYPAQVSPDRLMDSVRPPGEGAGKLRPLLRELERRDYSGFLTIEPHLAWRMPDASGADRFATALAALNALLDQLSSEERR